MIGSSRHDRCWEFFFSPPRPDRLWGPADHSPPFSAEVKNAWSCTSTPPFVFMAWCMVSVLNKLKSIIIKTLFSELKIYGRIYQFQNTLYFLIVIFSNPIFCR
jgi:hypothetical protein